MTAREMPLVDLVERRVLLFWTLPRVRTAFVKTASGRPVRRRRNRTRNRLQPLAFVPDARHRAEQAFGVRMMWFREDLVHRRLLHDLAAVHHDHARRRLGD